MITYEELMAVIYNIADYLLPYKFEKMCKHLENEIEKEPKCLRENTYFDLKYVEESLKHKKWYFRMIKGKDK